ncbi:MAG: 30S ribosomal protein S12 methylthiotransferase RimO [Cyanobacteriota/Melainabacteria group bacterium]|nr:30S ribosomal protein S12 methylthiotransferase RimO [Cyanobacteria bacterium HKST-UBA01]
MRNPKLGVVSLGCPKNTTDTEVMLGLLKESGIDVTFDNDEADMCLVNTCSFIGDARKESVRTLVELADQGKELIIAGCLAQHFKEELLEEIPEARALVGTGDIHKIVDVIQAISRDSKLRVMEVSEIPNDYSDEVLPRMMTGVGASAYLKIAEGCDHACSFCIIPMLRGKFRSRSIESLTKEARILVKAGVREIILVSQDSTYYGLDLYNRLALPELLASLNEIEGLEWIRVMYAYPTEATVEILEAIRDLNKVVKYIDIPLQHSDPAILKAMARPLKPESVVERIRKTIPDVKIRSTFIVGFPGETEENFQHLMRFIETSRFDRLGVFGYSKQTEVPSGNMPGQVSQKEKNRRRAEVMKLQHGISSELNQAMVGKEIDVLIESFDEKKGIYIGRSQWDAPDIDNQVYVEDVDDSFVDMGEIVRVRIDEAKPYDLFGTAVGSTFDRESAGSVRAGKALV